MVNIELSGVGNGVATWARDATANDSDKSFTVGAKEAWVIQSIYAEIATTASVGNRLLNVSITNGTDVIYRSQSTANIAASKNGTLYITNTGGASDTTARLILAGTATADVSLNLYDLPRDMILPAGYVITVKDTAAVAASADDMIVVLHYIRCGTR